MSRDCRHAGIAHSKPRGACFPSLSRTNGAKNIVFPAVVHVPFPQREALVYTMSCVGLLNVLAGQPCQIKGLLWHAQAKVRWPPQDCQAHRCVTTRWHAVLRSTSASSSSQRRCAVFTCPKRSSLLLQKPFLPCNHHPFTGGLAKRTGGTTSAVWVHHC